MAGLRDKVVVITGSSSGIGAASALEFAKHGAKLVIHGNIPNSTEDVAKRCLANGSPQVEQIVADFYEDGGAETLARETLKRFGTVHVLVNNAGANFLGSLKSTKGDTKSMDKSYRLTVRTPWQLCGLFVDELIKNKGSIINISSILGIIPIPFGSPYGIMKSGLIYMTRCMATELGMQGVRVNCILPGMVGNTDIDKEFGMTTAEVVEGCQATANAIHVLEQKVMGAEDIAKSVVFLASDDASRITGVNLPVDCGGLLASPAYDFAGSQAMPGFEQAE